jgi:hypothetical protein
MQTNVSKATDHHDHHWDQVDGSASSNKAVLNYLPNFAKAVRRNILK